MPVTPWLPWMLMGKALAQIPYRSTTQSFDTLDGFKPKEYAHIRKYHAEMLETPSQGSRSKPNLSSLEIYTRDQKRAPARPATP